MESAVFFSACPVEKIRPPSKLMQSLFELCVVVGMDEHTGLIPSGRSRKVPYRSSGTFDHDDLPLLLSKPYEPYILAVLSGQVASFPQTTQPVTGEPYYVDENVAFNSQGASSPTKSPGKLRFTKAVEMPFGTDVVFSLPQFCLPDGALVYDIKPDESIHTLVLTDIEGTRSYCSCLTFYKLYYATEDSANPGQFLLSYEMPRNLQDDSEKCYVPTCCCLISKFPYFQIAKDCLSSFLPVLMQPGEMMRQSLIQLISKLCLVPVPPPGPINIEFELSNLKHLVRSSGEPKRRIIDMEYHLPFLCFSVDNILLLLSCILTQQRIIFLSSDYSLLTPVAEALLSYIQPLLWSLTYVPVLPSNLLDLLEAPGSFIMGCHSIHSRQVFQLLSAQDEVSGIVLALIDDGEVKTGRQQIPMIPEPYRDEFKQKIKNVQFYYDLTEPPSISLLDINAVRRRRQLFNQDCANAILEVCLDLMLNLFSDFSHFIKGGDTSQQVLFDRVAFVDSKPEQHRAFFKLLCGSHAFSTYLCERYEKDEVDFFSTAISEHATSVGHRKRSVTSLSSSSRSSRSSSSLSNGKPLFDDDEIFTLTPFVDEGLHTGLFYEKCIKDLDGLVKSSDSKSSSRKACYLYLRGMMYVANGQIYEGLEDFFALSSKSVQIFPTNSIVEILSHFDMSAMEKLKPRSYFRKVDLLLRKHKKVGGSVRVRKQLIFHGVPRYPVGREDFVERVMLCQVTDSVKTAQHLFKALNAGGEQPIDPETFSDLYETLNQADLEAQSMDIQGLLTEQQEFVIKVSSLCKTDSGVGRLVLTNIRLLFMPDGCSNCEQVARLLDIANIEMYQHYSVLPPGVPALRITRKDKNQKPFTACLKGERDLWSCYLQEMAVSHERAEALKDPQFVSLGSQNVMLTDALIKSGVRKSRALMMCYFTKENEPLKEISGDTEKFLLQRLNPSEKDTTTTTVEALVYVPNDRENQEQIWCGMGSGSIVIFKPAIINELWNFETQISCANDRVSCLLAVGESRVWAGSFDATIYVIDTSSHKADQHLEEHSDYISAMLLEKRDSGKHIVWSASLNGQIIGWDAETLTATRRIRLDPAVRTFVSFIQIGKDFWCDIKSSIKIVDSEGTGNVKNTVSIEDEKGATLTVDCIVFVPPKWVWCGCGKQNKIAIFDTDTLEYSLLSVDTVENRAGFTKMTLVGNEVWVGNRDGHIYGLEITEAGKLKDITGLKVKRTLKIHDDSVRSMCVMKGGFVATGPGSRDGKIAIWRKDEETEEELGFETVDRDDVLKLTKARSKFNRRSCESVTQNHLYILR